MFRELTIHDTRAYAGDVSGVEIYSEFDEIVDTAGFDSVRVHTTIHAATSIAFQLQTAVGLDGRWRDVLTTAKTASGDTYDELECDPNAQLRLDRYLRWKVTSMGVNWVICFCVRASFEGGEAQQGKG